MPPDPNHLWGIVAIEMRAKNPLVGMTARLDEKKRRAKCDSDFARLEVPLKSQGRMSPSCVHFRGFIATPSFLLLHRVKFPKFQSA